MTNTGVSQEVGEPVRWLMSWVRALLFEAKRVFSFPPLAVMQFERQQPLGAAAADVGERGEGEKLWKPLLLRAMVWEARP